MSCFTAYFSVKKFYTYFLESIKKLKKFKSADSLVSVVKVPHNFNPDSIYNFDNQKLSSYSKNRKRNIEGRIKNILQEMALLL